MAMTLILIAIALVCLRFFGSIFAAIFNNAYVLAVILVVLGLMIFQNNPSEQRRQADQVTRKLQRLAQNDEIDDIAERIRDAMNKTTTKK